MNSSTASTSGFNFTAAVVLGYPPITSPDERPPNLATASANSGTALRGRTFVPWFDKGWTNAQMRQWHLATELRSGLRLESLVDFPHDTVGSRLGFRIIPVSGHPAFTRYHVTQPVVIKTLGRGIDFHLARSVADCNWESHTSVGWSRRILCKMCARNTIILIFPQ